MYILDACTIINLIHIDEEEFLLKKLKNLGFRIAPLVINELTTNAYQKAKLKPRAEKEEYNKYLDTQIGLMRQYQAQERDIIVEEVMMEQILDYTKRNGEFDSARLAFSLSRTEEKKVFFITDDQPAKEYFQPFFQFHQVGYIEDSIDLLTLFFWMNADFRENDYKKFLSKLGHEYLQGLTPFLDRLRDYYANFPRLHLRDPLRNRLRTLIDKLEKHDFSDMTIIWDELSNGKKFPELVKILDEYRFFLTLESGSTNILKKINKYMSIPKSKSIFTAMKKNS